MLTFLRQMQIVILGKALPLLDFAVGFALSYCGLLTIIVGLSCRFDGKKMFRRWFVAMACGCLALVSTLLLAQLLPYGSMEPSDKYLFAVNFKPIFLQELFPRQQLIDFSVNAAMFAPLGFFIKGALLGVRQATVKTIAICCGVSLLFEIIQLFSMYRVSDINDLIANTLGASVGAVLIFKSKKTSDGK